MARQWFGKDPFGYDPSMFNADPVKPKPVHLIKDARERGTWAACGHWISPRRGGMLTDDATKVTCKRCLKAIEKGERR